MLAKAVREVENAVQRGSAMPSVRTKYQVVALLAREERTRVRADKEGSEAHRAEQLKRLDGIATILAKTAARDSTLFTLLEENAEVSEHARELKKQMTKAAGLEVPADETTGEVATAAELGERRTVPATVRARMLAHRSSAPTTRLPCPRTTARAGSRAGSCSARSTAPSRRPAVRPSRAWRCRSRPTPSPVRAAS